MSESKFRPEKVISGGQTGADIGGLVGAKRAGIKTGGTAPRGFKTEIGDKPEELKAFGLVPHPSPRYKDRTKENICASDATIIFSKEPESSGTKLTVDLCKTLNKPYLLLTKFEESDKITALSFINKNRPITLNIAGNRESVSPGIASRVATFVASILSTKAIQA